MKSLFRDNPGQALVEIALIAPLFFLLVLGAVELGRVAYYTIEVESSARAGASYGAVNRGNAFTYPGTITQAAKNDAPDLSDLHVTPGTACVCETLDTATNTPSFAPSSGTTSCTSSTITSCSGADSTSMTSAITYVTVSTQATIDTVIHLPGLPTSYTIHGYCEMRVLPN